VNIRRDSRCVELIAGMHGEFRSCRFRCDAMKSHELNFADDGMGGKAIRCDRGVCAAGIAPLRFCDGGRGNE
jgi:hypothetical protein